MAPKQNILTNYVPKKGRDKKKTFSINDFRKQSAEYFRQQVCRHLPHLHKSIRYTNAKLQRVDKRSTYAQLETKSKRANCEKHFTYDNEEIDRKLKKLLETREAKRAGEQFAANMEAGEEAEGEGEGGGVKPQGRSGRGKRVVDDDEEGGEREREEVVNGDGEEGEGSGEPEDDGELWGELFGE